MRAARVDRNQAEIVAALRAVGAHVFDMHQVGHGFPDLAVYWRGSIFLLEIKMPGAKLTTDEMDWHLRHPGAATIVYGVDDALRAIGALAGGAKAEGEGG